MARYIKQKWTRPQSTHAIKYWRRDAPLVNVVIAEIMHSGESRIRGSMSIAYRIPIETVLHSHTTWGIFGDIPTQLARGWTVSPFQVRQLGHDCPDEIEGEYEDYDGVVHKTMHQNTHYLVEDWVDCGDDGHTHYKMRGYALITEQQWEEMVDPDFVLVRPIYYRGED